MSLTLIQRIGVWLILHDDTRVYLISKKSVISVSADDEDPVVNLATDTGGVIVGMPRGPYAYELDLIEGAVKVEKASGTI